VPVRKPTLATRIAAVVYAAFDFRIPEAAEKLGVEPWELFAIMAGDLEPTPEIVMRLVEVAQCPLSWIEKGDMRRVRRPMAVRIRAFLAEGGTSPPKADTDEGAG
jgi:hypothetical protein